MAIYYLYILFVYLLFLYKNILMVVLYGFGRVFFPVLSSYCFEKPKKKYFS